MDILIVTSEEQVIEACRLLLTAKHNLILADDRNAIKKLEVIPTIVFDFNTAFDDLHVYNDFEGIVFLNCVYTSLTSIKQQWKNHKTLYVGFNGLPTFIQRSIIEVSVANSESASKLKSTCEAMGLNYIVVPDQIGMVSLRVIFMIINEAYCTEEDGTASREDIDKAMKLGTNYPYGPFEWAEKIGKHHIVATLQSLERHTNDDRYRVCNTLLEEAKKSRLQ
jgi:3-hydroxybutyryl-CoA dehydrogenase